MYTGILIKADYSIFVFTMYLEGPSKESIPSPVGRKEGEFDETPFPLYYRLSRSG